MPFDLTMRLDNALDRQRMTKRVKVLQIPSAQTTRSAGIPLEPIRLPLGAIIEAIEQRIAQVLATYCEKKRGRPAGWSQHMHQALADVSAGRGQGGPQRSFC